MQSYILASLALALAATPALGQCPANPLTALNGTWTFSIVGTQLQDITIFPNNFVIAGQFTASLGTDRSGAQIGLLAITATTEQSQSTTRLEQNAGRYQINTNCTGGTLTMNLASNPVQYEFVFVNGGRSIYIISTTTGRGATGSATPGPSGCPAGVTPLSLLSGPYAFTLRSEANSLSRAYAISGRFEASTGVDRAGNQIGVLAVTASSVVDRFGSITRLEKDAGRFQINADCTGGTLTFNLSSRPAQFDFWFRSGFHELEVISNGGRYLTGVVSRAGAAACPANPLSLLTGASAWTFNAQAIIDPTFNNDYAVAGRFVATSAPDRGGNTIGVLNINATSMNLFGTGTPGATRLETDIGRFQIFDDCTGGTLTFNLSSRPTQFDFWFYNNGQSMYLVSTSTRRGATGSAHAGVTGCPAGTTDPLSLVSGVYSAKIQRIPNFPTESYGLVGLVGAYIGPDRAGNPAGLLSILATSNLGIGGSVARLETDAGQYQVEPDCTSGILTFNLSSRPVQYQFYFRAGFQTMDVIGLRGAAAYGVLSRY